MRYVEAILICDNIAADSIDGREIDMDTKLSAVQKILSMEAINAVNKDTLLNIVRWCFPMIWEEVPAEEGE